MHTLLPPSVLRLTETAVLTLLENEAAHLFPTHALASPRAVGDAVQTFLANRLQNCFPPHTIRSFESGFERRSMEDMAFYDAAGNYYAIDVKTHNLGTNFNMPNLISVRRLARFYENDTNTYLLLIVEYELTPAGLHYTGCHFYPIEHIRWECLTLGALGWGQIQIANANHILFDTTQTRQGWMLQLCDNVQAFYDVELGKIGERRTWFDTVREYWTQHSANE